VSVTNDEPYLPKEFLGLFPDHITEHFWRRCAEHELAFQRCSQCGTFRHPPGPRCHECRSAEFEWSPVAGNATVYSFTIVTHGVHALLMEKLPYNVVLVEFADAPGVRLISNVVDAGPEELEVGMQLQLAWEDLAPGKALPRFRKG
jgi:uncharacterized protein